MASPSPQLFIVQEWLRGYNESMNLDLILSQCSENIEFNMLPVGHGQKSVMTKSQYAEMLATTKRRVQSTNVGKDRVLFYE